MITETPIIESVLLFTFLSGFYTFSVTGIIVLLFLPFVIYTKSLMKFTNIWPTILFMNISYLSLSFLQSNLLILIHEILISAFLSLQENLVKICPIAWALNGVTIGINYYIKRTRPK